MVFKTELPKNTARPVVVGEVLFDRFPGGDQVLGGAPFNVAWHLQGFGANPLFISRIGDDESGRRVTQLMASWGMDLTGLETDPVNPTGAVDIRLSDEGHSFDILPNQAYDRISLSQLDKTLEVPIALLYQGTLVIRTEPVREVLNAFLSRTRAPLFVDLNLREPWWRVEDLPQLMGKATWAKLNETELRIVSRELGCSAGSLRRLAQDVQRVTGTELLIVTLGEKGAMGCLRQGCVVSVVPERIGNVVDTVGAGDAFAAVSILGLLHNWTIEDLMSRAQEFASQIVQQRGATTPRRELYDQLSLKWQLEGNKARSGEA